MKYKVDVFTDQLEAKRNLAASTAIENIERAVRVNAELTEIAAAEKMANEQIANNPLGMWLSESTRKRTEDLREVTQAEAKHASDESWKKYAKKFDGAKRQAWQKDFNQKLEAYDKKNIAPLASAHAAWMKSDELSTYFECNYDRHNEEVGAVYTTLVNLCITGYFRHVRRALFRDGASDVDAGPRFSRRNRRCGTVDHCRCDHVAVAGCRRMVQIGVMS